MAAATLGLAPAYGQQVAEPEGMPVYRQKKSSFFQNPFSNTYQKIWNRAKTNTDAPVSSEPVAAPHATNAEYAASDEATVISVDGQPVPVETPTKKFVKGRGGRILHTAKKPPSPTNKVAEGFNKVIHVNDVNEGTPAIGSEQTIEADDALVKSLAGGEQIISVKERVIGIYRDGKLVPVEATGTPSVPTPNKAVVPSAPVRKEVDPWFGDTVTAPSDEIRGSEGEPAAPAELVPPQSESEIPTLPGEEVIEQTSYTGPNGEQVTLLVPTRSTSESVVGVQVGEEMPAPLPVRKASATKLLAKYQTSYQK
jgi:hypothetical protein